MNKLIAEVIADVAERYGYRSEDILSHRRYPHLVKARHQAMVEARMLGFSYQEIGMAFSRDHTTVITAIKRATAQVNRRLRVVA